MRNAYFQLVNTPGGFGLKIFPALEGGEPIKLQELMNYLDVSKVNYDVNKLKQVIGASEEMVLELGTGPCPKVRENYVLHIAEDNMAAYARFFPASETADRMSVAEFENDMNFRQVKFGLQKNVLEKHFGGPGFYCRTLPIAKGKPARHGADAYIEYYFNTDVHAQPEQNEDGSVDYFHLNVVNHCKEGDLLAKLIPADEGEPGMDVRGNRLKPREVKRTNLHFGNNIILAPDRLSITSAVNGHVMLVGDQVFVSNVYEVENVDTSTGNIEFDGSVQINGNVATNFEVHASGNVVVNGVVEGATIIAGGNITIARGVNGMGKGLLKAGGNIIAKFVENATLEAEGYINTSSILHSQVSSGDSIVVTGKKGFITGGRVQAQNSIEVRTLGSNMGAATVIEVGANPKLKAEYLRLQKEIAEIFRAIKQGQPVVENFMQKKAQGARISPDQIKYVKETAAMIEAKKTELTEKNARMQELADQVSVDEHAAVLVTGEVYPGATIVIGDVSMNVQDSYKYCRFEKREGDVKMLPL